MQRTITVKGVGSISTKPDQIILSLTLTANNYDYEKAIALSSDQITKLNHAIESIGFEKGSLKTTNFNVSTTYERVKDKSDNYKSVFRGYTVTHNMKLTFDFETRRLGEVLSALGKCPAVPEMNIAFTVKNPSAVHESLLRDATKNARMKADILGEASGVQIGQLLSVEYNWADINVYSKTRFTDDVLACKALSADSFSADIEPENIDVEDTATFVWEIV